MPWIEPFAQPTVANTSTAPQVTGNPFQFFSYDLLTGRLIGSTPMRAVSFGSQLNTPGQAQFTIDINDPRVQATNPKACTIPNRTLIVVDYQGSIIWAGIPLPRRRTNTGSTSNTQGGGVTITCSEIWSYFQQRVQATDYSAPPYSGIVGHRGPAYGEGGMDYWTATPWDASLIGVQVIADAIGYSDSSTEPNGNLLGGMGLLLNGATPSGLSPAAPESDYIAVNYPFTSLQTVDTIITQLSQLGLGVGFDFGVDVAYSAGSGSTPVATINLSYPRRGRTVAQNNLMIDLTTARSYEFPEDGTQTANQVYELGGSSAIVVDQNAPSLAQGYPVWERVFSRANAQSANIMGLLAQSALGDLAMYAYAPVAPTVTVGLTDPGVLGAFTVGDDIRVFLPSKASTQEADGSFGKFDPWFEAGLDQEWRIAGWQANVADEGDMTLQLTLQAPPATELLAPTI